MSELFETYEKEFCDLSGAITCDINDLQTMGSSKQKVQELETKMSTLQEAIRNMELELASLPAAKKTQLTVRLRNFQANASNLKKEFEKAKVSVNRKELIGASGGVRFISAADEEHRDRLQANTDRLAKQSDTLKNARRLVGEMEDLGEDTKGRLRSQREGMERTLNTVRETNQEMTRTRKILSLIQRRSLMNKVIIFAVIFVLILVLVLIIYFKWIAPLFASSTPAPPPPPTSNPSVVIAPSPDPQSKDEATAASPRPGRKTAKSLRTLSALAGLRLRGRVQ